MFSRFYSSIKRYYVFSHSTLENQQQRVYLGSYFKILAERAEFSRLSYFFEASICSSGEHSKRRHAVIALVYTTIPVSGTCSHKGRVGSKARQIFLVSYRCPYCDVYTLSPLLFLPFRSFRLRAE